MLPCNNSVCINDIQIEHTQCHVQALIQQVFVRNEATILLSGFGVSLFKVKHQLDFVRSPIIPPSK